MPTDWGFDDDLPPMTHEDREDFFARSQRIQAEDDQLPQPTDSQIEDFLRRQSQSIATRVQAEKAEEVASQWVAERTDYVANPKNGAQLEEWLEARGLPCTKTNLDAAFEALKSKGLVEHRTAAAAKEFARQARMNATIRRANEKAAQERYDHPTLEEAETMDLDELRSLAITGKRFKTSL